jgi:hypothetical protein
LIELGEVPPLNQPTYSTLVFEMDEIPTTHTNVDLGEGDFNFF